MLSRTIEAYNAALASKKASEGEVELELRLTKDYARFVLLYEQISARPLTASHLTESIEMRIHEKEGLRRKESYYRGGEKKEERYLQKRELSRERYHDCAIVLSLETPLAKIDVEQVNSIRLKRRASLFPAQSPWHWDFSFIYEIKRTGESAAELLTKVSSMKGELFKKDGTLDNFLARVAAWKTNSQVIYEVEVERDPNGPALTAEEITAIIDESAQVGASLAAPSNDLYQKRIHQLAQWLLRDQGPDAAQGFRHRLGMKKLLNQPFSFDLSEYARLIYPNLGSYYLTDKADGERGVIILTDKIEVVLGGRVLSLAAPAKYQPNKIIVLDAEVILKELKASESEKASEKASAGAGEVDHVYAFDLLMWQNEKVTQKPFSERERLLTDAIALLQAQGLNWLEKKHFIRLDKSKLGAQIKEIYQRASRLYPIDGLIFTPVDMYVGVNMPAPPAAAVQGGTAEAPRFQRAEDYFDMKVYKWKPPDKITIDFLAMRAPPSLLGKEPYLPKKEHTLYFLFCGINRRQMASLGLEYINGYREIFTDFDLGDAFFPIQFAPSAQPYAYLYYAPESLGLDLHRHVVELSWSEEAGWRFYRLRADKDPDVYRGASYGNDFYVAEQTFLLMLYPLTLEKLINPPESYFAEAKSGFYRALTKFNMAAKAWTLRQLEGKALVVDLCSGKGADLHTYDGYRIRKLVCLEKDVEALKELQTRRHTLGVRSFYVYAPAPRQHLQLYVMQADLTEPAAAIFTRMLEIPALSFSEQTADAVVINFAIHYLIPDEAGLANVMDLVGRCLKPGGIFIFTCFSGKRVQQLLKGLEPGQSWDIQEGGRLKYSIRRKYKTEAELGNKIEVIHPFSGGAYYEEPLLSIEHVVRYCLNHGYEVRQNESFAHWLPAFKRFEPDIYDTMTEGDKQYASLYQYVSLWRIP